ncbi:MAG: MBL fold metallo-hydrolase [Deltaproteobacteria bacterium RIFOXYD12_FULL_50_9]|nr:MAG: MBL fold metallo-hydrolase [Deltaproteobacteria bacterium RIFOXYD12_FULL_50_9]
MSAVKILDDIYWVGSVDWNLRDFHGYSIYKGTTYNSYLVMDEKITLFDTVKKECRHDLLHNLRNVVDPRKIDYIVVNHVEMDHSGSLTKLMKLIKPKKLICSAMGKKALLEHYHREDWPYEVVENNQTISLGKRSVQFIETRMLHWPDSMFSYIKEDGLLISSDAFGEHWATSERFDDEVDQAELMAHAAKYYANILLLYSPLVQKLLASVKESGLDIKMIAPDHGVIWRSSLGKILAAYDCWSRQESKAKAVIVYDTMWRSTEKMAKAIAGGLAKEGISIKMMNLKVSHRSDIMTEVLDAKAVIFGSPTLNNGILPTLADILTYMKGLKPKGKIGSSFGSYGWSGESLKILNEALTEMKFEMVDPGIRVKNVPTHNDLKQCVALGEKIGQAIKRSL